MRQAFPPDEYVQNSGIQGNPYDIRNSLSKIRDEYLFRPKASDQHANLFNEEPGEKDASESFSIRYRTPRGDVQDQYLQGGM
jgi:hypothetical protein